MHNVELAPAELVLQPMILPRTVRFIQQNLSILPSLLFSPSSLISSCYNYNHGTTFVAVVVMIYLSMLLLASQQQHHNSSSSSLLRLQKNDGLQNLHQTNVILCINSFHNGSNWTTNDFIGSNTNKCMEFSRCLA